MAKPRDPSWLLSKHHPGWDAGDPELRATLNLWWAVLRQAAYDLRYGHQQDALDAIEFLKDTGCWLCTELYGVDSDDYKHEVAGLLLRRNREKDEHLYEG